MAERPDPRRSWPEIPDGYEVVAVEAGPDWRLETGRRCRWGGGYRRPACGKPSAAALLRAHAGTSGRWWAYCESHLYGRWIEDGRIMHWILRKLESA